MGSGVMDHFPENRWNKQLGRPSSEREHGTVKGHKTGHYAWNSESQDVETWRIVPVRGAESGEDSSRLYKANGQLQVIIGQDHQCGDSRYRLL